MGLGDLIIDQRQVISPIQIQLEQGSIRLVLSVYVGYRGFTFNCTIVKNFGK